MKNKTNRRLKTSLLMVAVVLSLAVAVILPVATVATEIKRVTQLENTVPAREEVLMVAETVPENIYDDEYEVIDAQMSADMTKEFEDRCRIIHAMFAGRSVEEQTAIMATVINREESSEYSDNFYDVVNTWEPFMPVSVNGYYLGVDMEEVHTQTIESVMDALCNRADPTEWLLREEAERLGLDVAEYAEGGALFFCHRGECDEEEIEAIKVKVQIGDYIFYKK